MSDISYIDYGSYRYTMYKIFGIEECKPPVKRNISVDDILTYIKENDRDYIMHNFRNYIDESQGDELHEIEIFDKVYTASDILFNMDKDKFNTEYNKYEKYTLKSIKKGLINLKVDDIYYVSCPWYDIVRIK